MDPGLEDDIHYSIVRFQTMSSGQQVPAVPVTESESEQVAQNTVPAAIEPEEEVRAVKNHTVA